MGAFFVDMATTCVYDFRLGITRLHARIITIVLLALGLSMASASGQELKPVTLLQPDELEVVQQLSSQALLFFFFGTRERGDLTMWSAPQRKDIIREGTQYAVSTATFHMYSDPSALRDSRDQIVWKDPKNSKMVQLSAPLAINVYSFALKEPVSTSRTAVIDGINRELSRSAWVDIPKKGKSYRLAKVIVKVIEGKTAPDGSKLHDITLLPLTVSIKGGRD